MSDDDYNFYAPGDYPAGYPNSEQKHFLGVIESKNENSMRDFIHQWHCRPGYFYNGFSMMELAAKADFEKGVEILTEMGISPDDIAYEGHLNALHYTILNDNYHMAKLLLQKGANPNGSFNYTKDSRFFSPRKKGALELAIEMDSPLFVRLLLKKGANPNTPDCEEPLIVLASRKAHPCIIDLLCEKGADINAQDKDGNTALHIAALTGNERLVKKLIERYHANTLIQNHNKDLPMHLAMQNPNLNVLKLLQKHGTPIYQQNIGKESVASLAVKSNNANILKTVFHWLHPFEAVYLKDEMITSLLPLAIQSKSPVATAHLLPHLPDLNAIIHEGQTPLQYICQRGNEQQLNALMCFYGQLEINKQDNLGNTALHYACEKQNKNMMLTLLEKGANPTIKNYFKEDVIKIAQNKGTPEFIKFVKEAVTAYTQKTTLITKNKPVQTISKHQGRQNM